VDLLGGDGLARLGIGELLGQLVEQHGRLGRLARQLAQRGAGGQVTGERALHRLDEGAQARAGGRGRGLRRGLSLGSGLGSGRLERHGVCVRGGRVQKFLGRSMRTTGRSSASDSPTASGERVAAGGIRRSLSTGTEETPRTASTLSWASPLSVR